MSYSFSECIGIWWHGKWQRVLLAIPIIKPEREGNKAPAWFRDWAPAWVWAYWLDDDRRPTGSWLYWYDYAARNTFLSWFDDLKNTAVSESLYWVAGWTGKPKHGYYTLEDWLSAAWTRVTSTLPNWILQVQNAILTTYNGLQDWARARYDAFRVLAQAGWNWITATGSLLSAFYDDVGTWIANFKRNPAGVILGVLGGTWETLVTFDQGALSYFYNLWGSYRQTLADFLADPLGWIYDQAEDFLVSKW